MKTIILSALLGGALLVLFKCNLVLVLALLVAAGFVSGAGRAYFSGRIRAELEQFLQKP